MKVSEDQITFYSYSGEVLKYNLYSEYFLRTQADFIDTFRIPIKRIRFDTIKNKSKKMVFQRLSLDVDVNKEPMQLKFFKKIYAHELLKKEFQIK